MSARIRTRTQNQKHNKQFKAQQQKAAFEAWRSELVEWIEFFQDMHLEDHEIAVQLCIVDVANEEWEAACRAEKIAAFIRKSDQFTVQAWVEQVETTGFGY